MNLIISYRNGQSDVFEEEHLNCTERTIKGHGSAIIQAWRDKGKGLYEIDNYNAVLLEEVVCVRVA